MFPVISKTSSSIMIYFKGEMLPVCVIAHNATMVVYGILFGGIHSTNRIFLPVVLVEYWML